MRFGLGGRVVAVASAGLCLTFQAASAGERDPWSGTYFGAVAGSGYGGVLGNLTKLGNFVIGIEAEAKSGSRTGLSYAMAPGQFADVGWTAAARGSVGVLAMPSLFVYATGGVQAVDFVGSSAINLQRETLGGLQLGAGLELKIIDQFSVRAEYLHTTLTRNLAGVGAVRAADPELDVFQVGLVYRF